MLKKTLVILLMISFASIVGLPQQNQWDVEGDHGPSTVVEFDTDEGTWMSCDVSPDGQSLVFDLLGAGNLADLMVMDRNPLESIRNTESIRFVMINGALFETDNMNQVYPEQKPRGKFFWER